MIPSDVKFICSKLEESGYEAFIVGGAVRDYLLGKEPHDWDIATNAKPNQIKACFDKTIDTGIKHGTVTVMLNTVGYEITTYRIDGEYSDSRHPDSVEFVSNLKDDLARRDFTINAMAMDKEGHIIDYFNGQEDLKNKKIRCVGDANARFNEDPLRMLRACRFAAQLDFHVEIYPTRNMINVNAHKLHNISYERIRDELTKMLISSNPLRGFHTAYATGVTGVVLPEFDEMMICDQNSPYHYTNVGCHCLDVVAKVSPRPNLRWAALLHDVGKPSTKTYNEEKQRDQFIGHPEASARIAEVILSRLKFSNADKTHILKLIKNHDYITGTPSKLRRFAAEMGRDFFEDFDELRYADAYSHSAEYAPTIQSWHDKMSKQIKSYFEDGSVIDIHGLKINGDELLDIGLQGKQIGEFLNKMLRDCLGQPSLNNHDFLRKQAIKFKAQEDRRSRYV